VRGPDRKTPRPAFTDFGAAGTARRLQVACLRGRGVIGTIEEPNDTLDEAIYMIEKPSAHVSGEIDRLEERHYTPEIARCRDGEATVEKKFYFWTARGEA
jgi:hypothetical protein